jgi:4-amino-4-deoxy-L-arabinose transferase-like glycosyltransferase
VGGGSVLKQDDRKQILEQPRGLAHLPGRSPIAWLWLGLLLWIGFFQGLGGMALLDETEPMFIESARQMYATGDWLTPMFNGAPRFDKPPLIYWLMASSFKLFGPQVWAAKVVCATMASLLVVGLFQLLRWLRRQGGAIAPPTPFLGAAIAALNLQMWFFGRLGYADMLLNLCIGGSLLSFFRAYAQPDAPIQQRWWYRLMFALWGLGLLTKGPVAVVLPGFTLGLLLVLMGQLRSTLREIPWKSGLLITSAIALPWYGLMLQRHGWDFINAFFGFHNVQRFTQVVNQHSGPWYYHFLILLPGLLPWSVALPAAIVQALRRPWRKVARHDQLSHLALIWFIVVMGFFTIASTKYLTYSLPALPAAALLITLWWNDAMQRSTWGLKATNWLSLLIFALLGTAAWLCPTWLNRDATMPNLGQAIARAGLPGIGLGLWAVGIILGLLYVRNAGFWRVKIITAAAFILLFVTPTFSVVDQVRQLPLRQIAQAIPAVQQANEPIAMAIGTFGKPSVLFYSQRSVALMRGGQEVPGYLAGLRQQVTPPRSVLLIATAKSLGQTGLAKTDYEVLRAIGIYRLVRIGKL